MLIYKSLSFLNAAFNNMWNKRISILENITTSSLSKHYWCRLSSYNPTTKLDNSTLNFWKFPICLVNWITLNFTSDLIISKIVCTGTFKLLKSWKVIRLKNTVSFSSKQRFTDPIIWNFCIFIIKIILRTFLVSRK